MNFFKDSDTRLLAGMAFGAFLILGLIWEPMMNSRTDAESSFVSEADNEKVTDISRISKDPKSYVTQGYGYTEFSAVHGGVRDGFHGGIDIVAKEGSLVLSGNSGRAIYIGDQDKYCKNRGLGKFIMIEGTDSYTLLYAHLESFAVDEGDEVSKGDMLGRVGLTGLTTGPHLHFSVFRTSDVRMVLNSSCGPRPEGGEVNPLDYLSS